MFKSNLNPMFRSSFAENIFNLKYKHEGCETWAALAKVLVFDVCGDLLTTSECMELTNAITELKFIPGGRYIYYAGRPTKFFNNCFLLRSEEDSREDWAELSRKAELCLASGGGIGNDYSIYRPAGSPIHKTGGVASGPLAKIQMIDWIGHGIMQGGSRRSAIYASLNHLHGDVASFLVAKNWDQIKIPGTDTTVAQAKRADFNFIAPMDFTNISINYDTAWLLNYWKTGDVGSTFRSNVLQALSTGEPGFSFNFFDKETETLRNACTEVTSSDDSDVCNLGSINLSRIDSIEEFKDVVELATLFLLCGTLKAQLPYDKVYKVREKNRRLGLGLMGIHEWLLKRGYDYSVTPELQRWLSVYRSVSDGAASSGAARLSVSQPVARRAIAPTGSIGNLAGTTTGIEPIFAVAYKRRYLTAGTKWKYEYVVDATADALIRELGVDPNGIETALDLANNPEKRIKFQADVQDYVDMSISSTINLPAFTGATSVDKFASTLASYAHRLRGFTCYPDGSRGGQPLTVVEYKEAKEKLGEVFEEHLEVVDICDLTGHGGSCGV